MTRAASTPASAARRSLLLAGTAMLTLAWGLHCVVTEDAKNEDDMVNRACSIAYRDEFAKAGGRIIITAGVPFGTPGSTNMLRIAYIASDGMGGI